MNERRYPQPANEDSFEEFCLVLLKEIWKMPQLARFAHRGEEQHGVDLLDLGVTNQELSAVQCKHHDTTKYLQPAELSAEVEKALGFPHSIKHYWVLTTAKRSAYTQLRVAEINRDHAKRGFFDVTVWAWEDIENAINQSPAAQRYLGVRQDEVALSDTRRAMSEVLAPVAEAVRHVGLDEAKVFLDTGKLTETALALGKIHSRSWSELTNSQKVRWLALRADVHLRHGEERDAAIRLLEALDYAPDDVQALTNAIAAKHLLDDPELNEFAKSARNRFPSSASLWAAVIATEKTTEAALAAITAVPHHLRDSVEIRIAEASRRDLVLRDPARLERAVAAAPDDVRSWHAQAHHLLSEEGRKLDPNGWNRAPVNRKAVEKAVEAFSKVIELASKETRPSLEIDARLQRASAHALLGDVDAVRTDVDATILIAPADPRVQLARAKLLLEERSLSSAIPLLRKVVLRGDAYEAEFLLATALWNRNNQGDREEAGAIMRTAAQRTNETAGIAHSMTVDALLATDKPDEARHFLQESAGQLDEFSRQVLIARVAIQVSDKMAAIEATSAALSQLTADVPRRPVTWLAKALVQIGRFQDAYPILYRLCEDLADPEPVRLLAFSASRLGRHGDVLRLGSRCRNAGIFDDQILEAEVRLLDRYDPDQAINVLEQILVRQPQNAAARAHLANLALRLERADILHRELDCLPGAATVPDAEIGAAVVQILRAVGRSFEAVVYGYELLRRFFDDPDAHRAFSHAVLWREQAVGDSTPNLQVVGPGMAVLVSERGRESWFVLEDSTIEAHRVESEIGPKHPLWMALLGKRVDDQVTLGEGRGLNRSVRVKSIISKFVFRARDVLDQWQYRFPGQQEFWMLPMSREDTGEFDPSALIEFAKAQRDRVDDIERVYQSNLVPLTMFGKILGKDAFHAALHVAGEPGLPIRCCVGSADERAAAIAALDACSEIILDATALVSLFLLGGMDLLLRLGKQIQAPHSVLLQVSAFLQDAMTYKRSPGAMSANEKGPILHIYTDEQKDAHLARVQRFKDEVNRMITATPTTALASMSHELREKMAQCMDDSTLDSVGASTVPGRLLWTDDGVLAAVARNEVGVMSVWTQAVLFWLLERGRIDETQFAEASAKLVGMDYTFTSLSPAILRAAYRLSGWGPFKEAV